MARIDPHRRLISGLFCKATFGAVIVCNFASAASVHAQSSDPNRLREIIDQKNAEAAQATWGDRQIQPAAPAPTSNSPSLQPSSSSGPGSASSGPSGVGSAGFLSAASGDGGSGSTSNPGASSDLPASDSAAAVTQPAAGDPSPGRATQPASLSDSASASLTTGIKPGRPARRASVSYSAGVLTIRADDSSLNQILREVASLTGMTITGGVAEERVFGNYGPANPSTVLSSLLGGTGSGVLLREGPHGAIVELILTPHGGATVPGPSNPIYDYVEGCNGRTQGPQAAAGDASAPRAAIQSGSRPDPSTGNASHVPQP
jgi:hypothetical protein